MGVSEPKQPKSWRFKKEKTENIRQAVGNICEIPETAEDVERLIQEICERELVSAKPRNCRQGKPWWTERLARLRKEYLKSRRSITRANRVSDGCPNEDKIIRHKECYDKFMQEKKLAKRRLHESLCHQIDKNPWGDAYRQAIAAIRPKTKARTPKNAEVVIGKLFPNHPPVDFPKMTVAHEPKMFTELDINAAAKKLKTGKSPGPDGIPSEIVKIIASSKPEALLRPMNRILTTREFPNAWKMATLKLLPKEGNTELTPRYRPICMINTSAKLMEHLINNRLIDELNRTKGISSRQHAFTKNKSCATALEYTIRFMEATKRRGSSWVPAMILLDVKNAFNSASWQQILLRLRNLKIDEYLIDLVASYFKDRTLNLEGKVLKLTSGVPQGSVLGPTLWNVLIDPITKIDLPDFCDMVVYADDIALLVGAKNGNEMRHRGNLALKRTQEKLKTLGLELATEKTTALIARGKRTSIPRDTKFLIGEDEIKNKDAVKYLGVHIDAELTFKKHAEEAGLKATRATNALSAILGTKYARMARRRIIARVVEGQLLYGCEVWMGRMSAAGLKEMESVHKRAAVRVAKGFHSMSGEAALVLTGMPPLELQARARQAKFKGEPTVKDSTMWQSRWQSGESTWTRNLIPNIQQWLDRSHGELSGAITEVLSGHGHFGSFLKMTGKSSSDMCETCHVRESLRHSLMHCPRYDKERTEAGLQEECDPRKVVRKMLASQRDWDLVEALMYSIVKTGKLRVK